MLQNYCINIDWLSITFKGVPYSVTSEIVRDGAGNTIVTNLHRSLYIDNIDNVTIVETDKRISNFLLCFDVFLFDYKIAEIYTRNQFNPELYVLRFENDQLYKKIYNYIDVVDNLEKRGLKFNNITRLDIAADSQDFILCDKYEPEPFINKFMNGIIKRYSHGRIGRAKAYLFKEDQPVAYKDVKYSYINFNKSCIRCTVYNKSQEQKQQKYKPYIFDKWNAAGIIKDSRDVWRVELRLERNTDNFVSFEGVEFNSKKFVEYIENKENITKIFNFYVENFYSMRVKTHTKEIITPLTVLDTQTDNYNFNVDYHKIKLSDKSGVTNYHKGLLNYIRKLYADDRQNNLILDQEERDALKKAYTVLYDHIGRTYTNDLNNKLSLTNARRDPPGCRSVSNTDRKLLQEMHENTT